MKGCFIVKRLILTVLMSTTFTYGLNLFINCCTGKYDKPNVYIIAAIGVVLMLIGVDFASARNNLDTNNTKLKVEIKKED